MVGKVVHGAVPNAGDIIRDANAARDAKKYLGAAHLYEEALRLTPNDAAIHIQCGHMFKEAGDLPHAERHYNSAKQLTPDDPDLALQIGHFYKVAGRLEEAELSFRRAIDLDPGWAEPANQLAVLHHTSGSDQTDGGSPDQLNGSDDWLASELAEPENAPDSLAPEPSVIGGVFQGAARNIIRRAEALRDAKKYRAASRLYEKALRLAPNDAANHIQCGHMFKEAGDLARAEHHYQRARELTPDDPDLAHELGKFYRLAGRLEEAELSFRRAIDLDPDWAPPSNQLAELYRRGWRNHTEGGADQANGWEVSSAPQTTSSEFASAYAETRWDGLAPELAPAAPETRLHDHAEEISVRWLGHIGRTHGRMFNILRGVDAIRGLCISAAPIVELRASLNGLQFYRGAIEGHPLKYERYDQTKKKYIFNIWYDFSHFRDGVYDVELQLIDKYDRPRSYRQQVVIGAPLPVDQYPNSDRVVAVAPNDGRRLEEQINAQPSVVRLAKRTLLPTPPRNVLIQRVDQLGDMVVSVPALRRLRELLPEAHLVGLVSFANADLARTLAVFDDLVAIDFPDDEWERRRIMPLEKQHELRRRLEPFKFDVAIDLTEANVSRPLLLLSGAPFLVGFRDDQSPWLTAFYEGYTRDPRNGHEVISPSVKLMGLTEWFGALLSQNSQIVPRDDLTIAQLAPYGLSGGERFAVLHTGARLKFSRWPYYDKLAAMILDQTDLKVVMMSDDPLTRSILPRALAASGRFQLLDKRLPFDDLDALLSFCTVFVGNDSGPSHLASLRGANVVNLFLARHNWNEWGHENRGYIVTRRVPCAGCNVHHDPEECGKDFACMTHIRPEEVFTTIIQLIDERGELDDIC